MVCAPASVPRFGPGEGHYIREVLLVRIVVAVVAGLVAGANVWRIGPREDRHFRTPLGYSALVVTTGLYVWMASVSDDWALIIAGWILIAGLVSAAWIDLLTHRLPRQVSYAILIAGLPFLVVASLVEDEPRRIGLAFLGLLLATVIMGILYLVGRGALGAGDVRLAPTLGLYLGWHGLEEVFYGIFLGFVLAAVVSIGMLILRRVGRKDEIPMGPFLVIGTLVVFIGATV